MSDKLAFFYDIIDQEIGLSSTISSFVKDTRTKPTIDNLLSTDVITEELLTDLRYRQEKIWYSLFNYLKDIRNYCNNNLIRGVTFDTNLLNSAPSTTITGSATGSGNIETGTYTYKVSYYSVDFNSDSPLGGTSAGISANNNEITLNNIQVYSGSVTGDFYRKIWRKLSTESVYKLVGIIEDNTSTSYVDNLAETGLYSEYYNVSIGAGYYISPTFPDDTGAGLTDTVIQNGSNVDTTLKNIIVQNEDSFFNCWNEIISLLNSIRDTIVSNDLYSALSEDKQAEVKGKRNVDLTLDLLATTYA